MSSYFSLSKLLADSADCLFCRFNIPVSSLIIPNVNRVAHNSIKKYCDIHLNQALFITKSINIGLGVDKNGIPKTRNKKYLDALKIEVVCRILS